MSAESLPIDPAAFALALSSLPLDTLHSKAAELRNNSAHLRSSNEQMLPFAEEGDQDCKDAMFENLVVLGRMNERLALLRAEVEKRGMRWDTAEVEDHEEAQAQVAMVDANGELVNGAAQSTTHAGVVSVAGTGIAGEQQSGSAASLPGQDVEMHARLLERMREMEEQEEGEQEQGGLHL